MESELDLNDIIQEMHVIATMPDLYHLLVELNSVHSLLGLLSHENTDILSHIVCFRLLTLSILIHPVSRSLSLVIFFLKPTKNTKYFLCSQSLI